MLSDTVRAQWACVQRGLLWSHPITQPLSDPLGLNDVVAVSPYVQKTVGYFQGWRIVQVALLAMKT